MPPFLPRDLRRLTNLQHFIIYSNDTTTVAGVKQMNDSGFQGYIGEVCVPDEMKTMGAILLDAASTN